MPIPWNLDVALCYWTERKFYVLDNGQNATTRIESTRQSRENRLLNDETELATIRSQLHLTNVIPLSPHSPVPSLQRWCTTLSWNKCPEWNSILTDKLLPSFTKLQKCKTRQQCQCANNRYMVPRYENIPLELRSLALLHVAALRPFDIDSGQYERMKYSYRKKTGILLLSCSKDPVEHKIALLPSVEDRALCTTALNFLLSTSSSFMICETTFLLLIENQIFLMTIDGRV